MATGYAGDRPTGIIQQYTGHNGMKKRTCKANTLIELVVLLGIVGTVGAFAYPRYAKLESNIHRTLVRNLGNNVQSSALVAHVIWRAQNEPESIEIMERSIDMRNGFPATSSIDDVLVNYGGFEYSEAAIANFRKIDASSPASCRVAYAEAAEGASPVVRVFTNGC